LAKELKKSLEIALRAMSNLPFSMDLNYPFHNPWKSKSILNYAEKGGNVFDASLNLLNLSINETSRKKKQTRSFQTLQIWKT